MQGTDCGATRVPEPSLQQPANAARRCLACNLLDQVRQRAGDSRDGDKAMVRSKLLFAVAVVLGSSAVMLGTVPAARAADPPKCEPDKLAAKYPSLVGKKVIIGQDGESPPYRYRDP